MAKVDFYKLSYEEREREEKNIFSKLKNGIFAVEESPLTVNTPCRNQKSDMTVDVSWNITSLKTGFDETRVCCVWFLYQKFSISIFLPNALTEYL